MCRVPVRSRRHAHGGVVMCCARWPVTNRRSFSVCSSDRCGALPGCVLKRQVSISGVLDGETVRSLRPGYVQHHQQLTAALLNAISKDRLAQLWGSQGGNVVW